MPVCVAAMKNGKHAATEVPAAMTLDDCWQLVEHAEKYRKHCVMMENCNYGRPEMMVFNMVRQGLFGEILHAEGGYLHDLREHQVLRTRARASGGGRGRRRSTPTSIRPMDSDRSPTAWTSTAAIASSTWCR